MTVDGVVYVCVGARVCVWARVCVKGECDCELGQFAAQRGRWRSGWVGNDIRCHTPQQQVPWQWHLLPPRCVNDINTDPPVNYRSPILSACRRSAGRGANARDWWGACWAEEG